MATPAWSNALIVILVVATAMGASSAAVAAAEAPEALAPGGEDGWVFSTPEAGARALSEDDLPSESWWAGYPNGTGVKIYPEDTEDWNDACTQNRCADCLAQPKCGWCPYSWTCMMGNETGPYRLVDGNWEALPCQKARPPWQFSNTTGYPQPKCQAALNTAIKGSAAVTPIKWDIKCQNGGQKHWEWAVDRHQGYAGDSFCNCPEGWTGRDCTECVTDDVCVPPANKSKKSTCAKSLVAYSDQERDVVKRFTCKCGGPSREFCNFYSNPPYVDQAARITFDYSAKNNSIWVEYMTPTEWRAPDNYWGGLDFVANSSNCVVTKNVDCPTGSQYWWASTTAPCAHYKCDADLMWGPSPFPIGQCKNNDQSPKSWRWRQCPPQIAFKYVDLMCQYDDNANNGTYRCNFAAPTGPIALECTTGTCIDSDKPPPPPPPPAPVPWFTKTDWNITILGAPSFVGLLFFVTCGVVLCRRQHELSMLAEKDALKLSRYLERQSRATTQGSGAPRPRGVSGERPLLSAVDARSAARSRGESAGSGSVILAESSAVFEPVQTLPEADGSEGSGVDPGELVFAWDDITYRVSNGRQILHGVSGAANSSMFAILGPSGAGKTTLLDILAGRKSNSGGTAGGSVTLNGVHLSPAQLRRTVGYVLQDDVMMGTQTVREYLLLQARLRLPERVPLRERYRRVDAALGQLGLRHIADSKIGGEFVRGISGGEKRRVSIAAELITDAAILLLDEPTSGLDSASAKAVVDALAGVAARGRIVIMSIHQPRSYIWSQFDHILLLAKTGETLYSGRRDKVLPHFASLGLPAPDEYNPADFLLDTVAALDFDEVARVADACPPFGGPDVESGGASGGASGGDEEKAAADADGIQPLVMRRGGSLAPPMTGAGSGSDPGARYYRERAGFRTQVWELSVRACMNIVRNPFLLVLNYGLTLGVAAGVASVFHNLKFDFYGLQDRLGLIFFCFLFFSMTSLSSLGAWREERLLFLRERAMGCYDTTAYFVAKVTSDLLPLRVLPPLIFTAIVYWNVGLQDEPVVLARFAGTLVLVNLTSAMLCLGVGALVPNTALANLIASTLSLYELLFCGLLSHNVASDGSVLYVLQRGSYLNYAFEILAVNELVGTSYNLAPKLPGGSTPESFPASGSVIAGTFGLSLNHMDEDLAAMGVFLAAFLGMCFIILKFVVRERR